MSQLLATKCTIRSIIRMLKSLIQLRATADLVTILCMSVTIRSPSYTIRDYLINCEYKMMISSERKQIFSKCAHKFDPQDADISLTQWFPYPVLCGCYSNHRGSHSISDSRFRCNGIASTVFIWSFKQILPDLHAHWKPQRICFTEKFVNNTKRLSCAKMILKKCVW